MARLSDHFDGERFFNPGRANGRGPTEVPKMLAETRQPWPSSLPVHQQRPAPHHPDAWVTLTFVGHSTFLIQTGGATIITDPVFSKRASPLSFVGPRRVRDAAVAIEHLPPIDIVLLSHNHYDHCDLDSLRYIRKRFDPVMVTPLRNGRIARKAGYHRVEELDWWEQTHATPLPVTLTPAQHFSARTPFDRNRALWGSFVVDVDSKRLFFAGDSGYAPHFADVRARLGEVDLALLPIGAYEPRWFMRDIHMNPEEAVQAHLDLGSLHSVGMHFGTFRLTTEAIDEPLRALEEAKREKGVHQHAFRTLDFGQSVALPR
ncbi:MAG: MBL fold metallo-hydrolase [Vicinamibacterales bacterium]